MSLPLEPVLAHLEGGLDASIERWKALLRIPSIGTDPAHRADTRRAAAWPLVALRRSFPRRLFAIPFHRGCGHAIGSA